MNTLPIYVEDDREEFVYIRRPGLGAYWRVQAVTGEVEEVFQLPTRVTNVNDEDREADAWNEGYEAGRSDGYDNGYDDGFEMGRDED